MTNQSACDEVASRYNTSWIDPDTRPRVTTTLKVIYIISMSLVISTFIIMRIMWSKYEWLRARGFVFFFVTTLGVLIFLQSGPLQEILGKARIPCIWNLISSNLVVPFIGGSLVGRLLNSMNRTTLARAVMTVPLERAEFAYKQGLTASSSDIDSLKNNAETGSRHGILRCFPTSLRNVSRSFPTAESTIPTQSPKDPNGMDVAGCDSSPTNSSSRDLGPRTITEQEFRFWVRLSSLPGRVTLMLLILSPFILASIILIIAEPQAYVQNCYGCAFSKGGLLTLVITGVGVLVFAAIASWRIRSFPDPFGIVQECRYSFLFGGLPALVFFALDKWEPTLRGSPTFSWIIPEIIGVMIMFVVHGPLQLILAFSDVAKDTERRNKVRRESLMDSRMPQLEDVLSDAAGVAAFEKFLVSVWASESLRFYLEVRDWTHEFHDLGYRTALSRARRIVRVFVDLSGSMTVNLKHEVVGNLVVILDGEPNITNELFEPAIKEILTLMRTDSFFRFRDTEAYREYSRGWKMRLASRHVSARSVESNPEDPKESQEIVLT